MLEKGLDNDTRAVLQQGTESMETKLPHGVMEGHGAYNKHAMIQAGAAALATPLLERAVSNIVLEGEDQPMVIADYGSSQGKNSLCPMRIAIQNLRRRTGPNRAIFVYHVDQASNDFNSLFEVLSSDPDRYVLNETNVYPCAIGRSFYEQVLPPESVHLGWSSFAAVWLRRAPSLITGHFWSVRSTGAERAAFERQAAEDWEAFLTSRAGEMRRGARLVVVLPTLPQDGSPGIAPIMDDANDVLAEMVEGGAITAVERARMVIGSHPRRKGDLLAPFAKDGRFQRLVVEDCEESLLPDAAWAEYQADGDKQALATKRALFFRSIWLPSLASALTRVRAGDIEAQRIFADCLQDGLIRRQASRLAPADMLVQTIIFAKCG
jgi:hypothetical protein